MKLFSTTTTTTTAALLLALNFFFSAISFANVGAAVVDDGSEVLSSSSWKVLDNAFLPTPLSDNTATYIPASSSSASSSISGTTNSAAPSVPARIYISGGCDSPRGNTYVDANGLELDFFMCESISSKLYGFIPATKSKSNVATTTTDTDTPDVTVNTTEGRNGNGNGNGDDVQGSGGGGSSIVVTLTDMPRPRYRHSAVATSDGKLWLIGGRTIPDDTIIPEVDVSIK
jgi:hypothetical protein